MRFDNGDTWATYTTHLKPRVAQIPITQYIREKKEKNWIVLLRLRISIEHEVRIITASFDSSSKLLFEQVLNENVKP